ncbi:hypothetical protein Anas_02402 [Armadillidium nasatum]|uniref:Uncharacterized protein n=1 Tax=Armadillidium nasatum TaxID=96803 RepID=A0A5N5TPM6_9CRUS|nr:hypothetical protein Anas_02402 [Armadillidium nasatum]
MIVCQYHRLGHRAQAKPYSLNFEFEELKKRLRKRCEVICFEWHVLGLNLQPNSIIMKVHKKILVLSRILAGTENFSSDKIKF